MVLSQVEAAASKLCGLTLILSSCYTLYRVAHVVLLSGILQFPSRNIPIDVPAKIQYSTEELYFFINEFETGRLPFSYITIMSFYYINTSVQVQCQSFAAVYLT